MEEKRKKENPHGGAGRVNEVVPDITAIILVVVSRSQQAQL